jgi:hypothetical protein
VCVCVCVCVCFIVRVWACVCVSCVYPEGFADSLRHRRRGRSPSRRIWCPEWNQDARTGCPTPDVRLCARVRLRVCSDGEVQDARIITRTHVPWPTSCIPCGSCRTRKTWKRASGERMRAWKVVTRWRRTWEAWSCGADRRPDARRTCLKITTLEPVATYTLILARGKIFDDRHTYQ